MRHARLFLLLIVLTLVVAACTSDSDDTTTTAASTTTAEPEEPHPLPQLNPPSVDEAGISPYVAIGVTRYSGFDRCAWPQDEYYDLWDRCRQMAETAYDFDAVVAEFTVSDYPTEVLEFRDGNDTPVRRCFIVADEIVTTAPLDVVVDALEQDVDPYLAPVEDESDILPAALLAYQGVDDPVAAADVLTAAGIPASPRHVLMPSARWKFGPAGPALPAHPAVEADQGTLSVSRGATITVIDTGSEDSEPTSTSAAIRGHGQFIAGILKRLLPGTLVVQRSAFATNGSTPPVATEHSVILEIDAAVAASGELSDGGVINLSLGTYGCTPDQLPLELAARLGEMAAEGLNVVVVAAAGNDSHDSGEPAFWPAGFSDPILVEGLVQNWENLGQYEDLQNALEELRNATNVIGVGALVYDYEESRWMPAAFSNHVGAAVWAPGANIVSTYSNLDTDGDEQWKGVAQWDGTSFAAPHVAAAIANCAGLSGDVRGQLSEVDQPGSCMDGA